MAEKAPCARVTIPPRLKISDRPSAISRYCTPINRPLSTCSRMKASCTDASRREGAGVLVAGRGHHLQAFVRARYRAGRGEDVVRVLDRVRRKSGDRVHL